MIHVYFELKFKVSLRHSYPTNSHLSTKQALAMSSTMLYSVHLILPCSLDPRHCMCGPWIPEY